MISSSQIWKRAWLLYRYIHLVSLKNRLNTLSKAQGITLTLLAGYLAITVYGFGSSMLARNPESAVSREAASGGILWIIITLFALFLWNAGKLEPNPRASYLISISGRRMNAYILYLAIKTFMRPIMIAMVGAMAALKTGILWLLPLASLTAIVFLCLASFVLTSARIVIAYCHGLNTPRGTWLPRVASLAIAAVTLGAYALRIDPPGWLAEAFGPLTSIVKLLHNPGAVDASPPTWSVALWIILSLAAGMGTTLLLTRRPVLFRYHGGEREGPQWMASAAHSPRAIRRLYKLLNFLAAGNPALAKLVVIKKGFIAELAAPIGLYVLLMGYACYSIGGNPQDLDVMALSMMSLIYTLAVAIIFVVSFVHKGKSCLWLYKVGRGRLKRHTSSLLKILYCLHLMGLMLGLAITTAVVYAISAKSILPLLRLELFLPIALVVPLLPLFIGVYLGHWLPEAAFYAETDNLNVIYMIPLIWLSTLVTIPAVAVLLLLGGAVPWMLISHTGAGILFYLGFRELLWRGLRRMEV